MLESLHLCNNKSPVKVLISCLLFLFLLLTNTLTDSGSIILTIFLLIWLALLLTGNISQETNFYENLLVAGFLFYYAANLFSFVVHGLSTDLYMPRSSHLDNELRMLAVVPLYFLMRQYKPDQSIFWYGLSIGAIVCGIMALYQLISLGPDVRASGAAHHPIAFAFLSTAMAFMVVSGWEWFRLQHKYLPIVPAVALILGLTAAILSQTRGAWLAFPFLFLLFIWQYRKKYMPMFLVAVTIAAIGVTSMVPGNPLAQRTQLAISQVAAFSEGKTFAEGASARLELWKVALDIFQEHPVLGIGQGGFKPVLLEKISKGEVSPQLSTLKEPHNTFLNGMVNSGLLGFLAVAVSFGVPFYLLIRFLQKNPEGSCMAYAGIILVVSFLIFGQTVSLWQRNIYINYYLIMLAFILSHLQALASEKKKRT